MGKDSALIVKVDIQEVGDHFYASSGDVPGLHVCGNTRDEVSQSAVAAMIWLFKRNRGMNVRIVPAHRANELVESSRQSDKFVALAA